MNPPVPVIALLSVYDPPLVSMPPPPVPRLIDRLALGATGMRSRPPDWKVILAVGELGTTPSGELPAPEAPSDATSSTLADVIVVEVNVLPSGRTTVPPSGPPTT